MVILSNSSRLRDHTEHQHEPEPERRHRLAERGEGPSAVVERAAASDRRVDADRERDDDRDEHGEAAELERGPVALGDQVEGRASEPHGPAEVSLERLGRELPVLDVPRAVEAEVRAHQLDVGLRRLGGHHDLDGIAGGRTSAKTTTDTTTMETTDWIRRPTM